MENVSILSIGDSTIDRIMEVDQEEASLICNRRSKEKELCFAYGEKIPIKKITKAFGGSALNTSVGFRKLGLKSYISTIFGNDNDGKEMIDFLNNLKIGLHGSFVEGETNQSSVIIYEGERTILSYHQKRDYSKLDLPKTDWIYLASAAKGSNELIKKIIQYKESGSKIAFNPGSWQLKRFDLFTPILENCDILLLNKTEADLVVDEKINTKAQIEKCLRKGTNCVVITDAANGAYIGSKEKIFHMNILASRVVDSTGAGDAFSSAFVAAIALNKSFEEASKWGMINSSSVIEEQGATAGLLTANEIEDICKSTKSLETNIIS